MNKKLNTLITIAVALLAFCASAFSKSVDVSRLQDGDILDHEQCLQHKDEDRPRENQFTFHIKVTYIS